MLPHCDTMDGPVVIAARRALEADDVDIALAYVPRTGEAEVRVAFDKVQETRKAAPSAREVAELYFLETVVRVHRAGEGAACTGLKPAGLDEGPFIPVAEKAIETGSPDALIDALTAELRIQLSHRFDHMTRLQDHDPHDIAKAREAMLSLQVFSHKLHGAMHADAFLHHSGHEPA